MTSINTPASGHGNKSEVYAGGLTIHYNTFLSGTARDIERLNKIKRSVHIIDSLDKKINLYGPCNKYFKSLPKGRSFSHFWRDNSIFINLSPSSTAQFYGATHSNSKDLCVSAWCLDTQNRWMVSATIIHEIAHIAGAPGGASHAAEKATDKCGFKPQYDPMIIGSIEQLGKYLERLA